MTVQEIIDELDEMTSVQVADWDTKSNDGVVDTAGEGGGALRFATAVTANAFDSEDDASQLSIISSVNGLGTHIISQNQGGDPKQ